MIFTMSTVGPHKNIGLNNNMLLPPALLCIIHGSQYGEMDSFYKPLKIKKTIAYVFLN